MNIPRDTNPTVRKQSKGGEKNMKAPEAKIYDEARIFVLAVQSLQYSMRDELERLRSMPRVIKGNELRWTGGPQLWHKTLIDPHFNLTQSVHIHYVDLAPKAKSQKHGRQNEALCYIFLQVHDSRYSISSLPLTYKPREQSIPPLEYTKNQRQAISDTFLVYTRHSLKD